MLRKSIILAAIVLLVGLGAGALLYAVEEWSLPLTGEVIVLDPGHGGLDGGASYETILEKNLTLSIAKKLQAYLEEQGAIVILSRETDKDLAAEDTKGFRDRKREDLKQRLELINNKDNDLFISIHLNAIPEARWKGPQTFYTTYNDQNERLARFIQHELNRHIPDSKRKSKPIDGIYVLSHAETPGVLVEAGFLSNPEERYWLLQDDYQQQVAAAIYIGILRHYSKEDEPPE
ncbi:N-acetylmuramoyl-L-alanine amidase CwlD [Jeotgalibacillus haloalkalitolerans]|uniref:N-acetylmuramoyl-L-alanine amidase CwlD n=1 Tax=Jeotgalibacillus haloalkalitolerans TaxID=3104292 RepID=A0ABU5KR21_9BACL|nr:N-acetylmuramoyl-L-alanine amidase CwlD [Jeotgalibacillus sp. HH7-29]MDZ5713690.1 N-acetylmuramoyl-L-alanine amidase CwlD [Jeotgalibacillus sp. HH7-29]